MNKKLVMTLSGQDRVGLVEHITKRILDYHGNVEESCMSRLGGEFAVLMLISVPEDKFTGLQDGLSSLKDEGFKLSTSSTDAGTGTKYSGWVPYQIEVNGADHEGIVHTITEKLAEKNVNIENMGTRTVKAPMSGIPLFMMKGTILVPPEIHYHKLQKEFRQIGDDLNVDVEIEPYKN